MLGRTPSPKTALLVPALLAASVALSTPATAKDESSERARAAELYDRAVALHDQAKYAEAARAFLEADRLSASSDALSNAIAAARRAHDHLLVAQASQRAIDREASDPKLAADARAALAEAAQHLARLEVHCQPTPCTLSIEQARVGTGLHYLLPGTHAVAAEFAGAVGPARQKVTLTAGALYTITLEAPAKSAAKEQTPAPAKPPAVARPPRTGDRRPLPPWAFYAGAGATVVVAGLTVWSGIDALDDVDRFETTRRQGDRDTALSSMRRSDALLGGTVVLAALTAGAGIWLTDFGIQEEPRLSLASDGSTALLSLSGRM